MSCSANMEVSVSTDVELVDDLMDVWSADVGNGSWGQDIRYQSPNVELEYLQLKQKSTGNLLKWNPVNPLQQPAAGNQRQFTGVFHVGGQPSGQNVMYMQQQNQPQHLQQQHYNHYIASQVPVQSHGWNNTHNQPSSVRQCYIPVSPPIQQHPVQVKSPVSSTWFQQVPNGSNVSSQLSLKQFYQNAANSLAPSNQQHLHRISGSQTSSGIVKKIGKRKRLRTAFTTDQVLALESVYNRQTYINKDERKVLTQKLNISDRAIKVWFQNRRMKGKRESIAASECSDEYEYPEETDFSISESNDSSPSSDLDYLESQIERPDEFGYVTLDDKVLGTLFNVIEAFVPANFELSSDKTMGEIRINSRGTEVMYEPISPAATNDTPSEDIGS